MASTDNELLISKNPPASPAMDFSFLRTEGVNYIRQLASDGWTDYNLHDPGITILEALAYAITDLSARAGKPVSDLLASKPGALPGEKDFFPAAEILPCSPVTLNDFRKLLIDQPFIKNAWLSKSASSEQSIYLDVTGKTLGYTGPDQVILNGLYNVLLEFQEDPVLGDLNSSIIQSVIGIASEIIEVAFPFWDEIPAAWATDITIVSITLEDVTPVPGEKLRLLDAANDHDYFAILDVTYNGAIMDRIPVTIKVPPDIDEPTIIAKLADFTPLSLVKEYNQRIIRANVILAAVRQTLSRNRNLCEDFFAFRTTRVQEIGVTATLIVAPGIDLVQTLAQLFFRLDSFFSPPIPFHSLEEMQAMPGNTTDRIFEGPLLNNGFIDDDDLLELKRSDIVYTSDLIRIILSLNDDFNYGNSAFANPGKGIIAVEDLTITNYINNQPITAGVRNCLQLTSTDIYKARLSIDKSVITVIRDTDELSFNILDVENAFNLLKTAALPPPSTPTAYDIAIPQGIDLDVEDYYSIQNDFPLVYGIGKAGLAASSTNQRKAQAKQLKGFLLFSEQLLADYLSQLAHVKDLFSINAGVNQTYFYQLLTMVPDVTPLLTGTYPASIPALLSELEQSPTAISRRNNFLDHLLARFGEDFSDFALLMYSKYGNAATAELITDKSAFLVNYADISYNRSRSFDYTDPAAWGSPNVPWLKRRICGLLGIGTPVDLDLAGVTTEGFHMIENILLRPKINDIPASNVDLFLKVELDADGNVIPGKQDPYSFRLTFVFPNWPARFADPDFKKYIEKIIQRETPAHILAEIYWTDAPAMLQFETAFKAWLVANASGANETTLTNAKNQFITILNGLL
jgi:hypothetical protein